jgi:predicted acyl esterase
MGPWSHGDWARNSASAVIGNIKFGDSISSFRKNQTNFFRHFLKMVKAKTNYKAMFFDTGAKDWKTYDVWLQNVVKSFYLAQDKLMTATQKWWISRIHQ